MKYSIAFLLVFLSSFSISAEEIEVRFRPTYQTYAIEDRRDLSVLSNGLKSGEFFIGESNTFRYFAPDGQSLSLTCPRFGPVVDFRGSYIFTNDNYLAYDVRFWDRESQVAIVRHIISTYKFNFKRQTCEYVSQSFNYRAVIERSAYWITFERDARKVYALDPRSQNRTVILDCSSGSELEGTEQCQLLQESLDGRMVKIALLGERELVYQVNNNIYSLLPRKDSAFIKVLHDSKNISVLKGHHYDQKRNRLHIATIEQKSVWHDPMLKALRIDPASGRYDLIRSTPITDINPNSRYYFTSDLQNLILLNRSSNNKSFHLDCIRYQTDAKSGCAGISTRFPSPSGKNTLFISNSDGTKLSYVRSSGRFSSVVWRDDLSAFLVKDYKTGINHEIPSFWSNHPENESYMTFYRGYVDENGQEHTLVREHGIWNNEVKILGAIPNQSGQRTIYYWRASNKILYYDQRKKVLIYKDLRGLQ